MEIVVSIIMVILAALKMAALIPMITAMRITRAIDC
jgi:hypothetical protein